jgi:hypothetical protein
MLAIPEFENNSLLIIIKYVVGGKGWEYSSVA